MSSLCAAQDIEPPKIEVRPPAWIMAFCCLVAALIIGVITQLPIAYPLLKWGALVISLVVLLGVIKNFLKGNFLVTLQGNSKGLYFQTTDQNRYFHVPWENIGSIEKTIFPLNRRGLRFQILGDAIVTAKNNSDVGNVISDNGRTYIYTIPQLLNRDKLIAKLESLRP